jgi:hypothetical protein
MPASTDGPKLPIKRKVSSPPAVAAENKQTHFINILKTDHNFDLIKKIVDHMLMIERAKRIKPQEKHRLLQNYYLTLLSYAMPKLKVVQDDTNQNRVPMKFTINIGDTGNSNKASKKAKGLSITIPTKKSKDGTYSVSNDPD